MYVRNKRPYRFYFSIPLLSEFEKTQIEIDIITYRNLRKNRLGACFYEFEIINSVKDRISVAIQLKTLNAALQL
ncbi:hypothetical protein V1477_011422 [Vespula maculifrons]|uniref:Uncharacterized protein n=1 Tax=Vespula maculifrons TaxID=7453 RepID=A0ABD2C0R4_VESMC